jgi:CelD/BcsL family acetyltransferase involved in cellulose biosynthesis
VTAPAVSREVCSGLAGIRRLQGELDELCDVVGVPITARTPWLTRWATHHRDWEPWTIVVRREHQVVGAALLAKRRRRAGIEIRMLGSGQSDYAALPARSPADAEALAGAIETALTDIRLPWTARLEQLPTGDPTLARLSERLGHCVVVAGDPSPYAELDGGADPLTLVSKNGRANAKKARNRLAREKLPLQVVRTRESDQIAELLPALAALRRERDDAKGLISDHDVPGAREFWFDVLGELARRGSVEATGLWIGSDLAAYAIALLDPPAYRIWDTRIAPAFGRFSPGHLLRDALMEGLRADQEWHEFDSMRGTEQYKHAVARELRETAELRAWSSAFARLPVRLRAGAARVRDSQPTLQRLDTFLRHKASPSGDVTSSWS